MPPGCWPIAKARRRRWIFAARFRGFAIRPAWERFRTWASRPNIAARAWAGRCWCKALAGFQQAGLKQAFLEVTAQNAGAIHLYQQIGLCPLPHGLQSRRSCLFVGPASAGGKYSLASGPNVGYFGAGRVGPPVSAAAVGGVQRPDRPPLVRRGRRQIGERFAEPKIISFFQPAAS